jgi:hypothetical protein
MIYDWEGSVIVVLTNLSHDPQKVKLIEYQNTELSEIFSDGVYEKKENAYDIPIHGYGYR